MAIRKVLGIETEYGIQLRGAGESNPIAASSMLINAYVAQQHRKVGWDFEDESPGRDARGFSPDGTMAADGAEAVRALLAGSMEKVRGASIDVASTFTNDFVHGR